MVKVEWICIVPGCKSNSRAPARELLKTKLKDGANPCFTCSQELVEDIRSNEDSSNVTLPMNQDNEENLIESSRSNHDSSDITLIMDRDDEKNLVEENVTVLINTSISSPVSSLFELQSTSSMYCEEQG
ncbi:hypothetical protein ALC60_10169 [Trachymyrmex zeteki]|uniref:Uncharacterized protein n=1 Tax=Mycetomoellerius zeteki TaxID=64791 RepID=A0A151WSB4_9HYME|nr:hypothetical protein ALC60_10169 [Trachymyrmex zeteki]